jgi:outer membrane cobalamin receptor
VKKSALHDEADSSGQAFLSTVLVLGGIIVVIAVTIAMVASTFIDSGYGSQALARAEATATAGVNDAFLRLVRTSSFSSSGYDVTVPGGTAVVTVTQNSPIAGDVTVLSSATVSGRTRKISAVFSVNLSTGHVSPVSWQDVQ